MATHEIDIEACRVRQQRLLAQMESLGLDLVIVTRSEHVQWLAGPRFGWMFDPAAALWADGHLTLVAPDKVPDEAAADDVLTYEAKWQSTVRNDGRAASSAVLLKALSSRPEPWTIGGEFSAFPPCLAQPLDAVLTDIEPTLFQLRRRKDADELAALRRAIAATGAMYRAARELVAPGVNELDVFNALQSVAVRECGEMLTGTGNDYQSGQQGGLPRDRAAQAGELYILDLGPAYRGYFADNCRTFSVDRRPTDRQQAAHEHVRQFFATVERTIRPGYRCRDLYETAQQHLESFPGVTWQSHLGHGIGLFPHEAPHLNPHWDDVFEIGDVIAVEPAIYAPDLRAGVRLENNYLVTAGGVELLSDFSPEL